MNSSFGLHNPRFDARFFQSFFPLRFLLLSMIARAAVGVVDIVYSLNYSIFESYADGLETFCM